MPTPPPLLLLLPLTTSTALLVANWAQASVLQSWLSPTLPTANKVLPHWYNVWVSLVLWFIGPVYLVSLSGTFLNAWMAGPARPWLVAELVFTLAHLVFAGRAYRYVQMIGRWEGDSSTNFHAVEGWLRVNRVRFWCTDVPAWVCAVVATKVMVGM